MNDNVIKFEKRQPPPKPPRPTPPWMKRAITIALVVAAFVLAFAYYYITGDQSGLQGGASLN